MRISLPALESDLPLQEEIRFQTRSLIKAKVLFLLLPTIEGRPRYLPVPITRLTPKRLAKLYWISLATFLLKKTSGLLRLIDWPEAAS